MKIFITSLLMEKLMESYRSSYKGFLTAWEGRLEILPLSEKGIEENKTMLAWRIDKKDREAEGRAQCWPEDQTQIGWKMQKMMVGWKAATRSRMASCEWPDRACGKCFIAKQQLSKVHHPESELLFSTLLLRKIDCTWIWSIMLALRAMTLKLVSLCLNPYTDTC